MLILVWRNVYLKKSHDFEAFYFLFGTSLGMTSFGQYFSFSAQNKGVPASQLPQIILEESCFNQPFVGIFG